jgi:hypothetical protein
MKVDLGFDIGERVLDDLTGNECSIVGLTFQQGIASLSSKVNNVGCLMVLIKTLNEGRKEGPDGGEYLQGLRHPWEVTKLKK